MPPAPHFPPPPYAPPENEALALAAQAAVIASQVARSRMLRGEPGGGLALRAAIQAERPPPSYHEALQQPQPSSHHPLFRGPPPSYQEAVRELSALLPQPPGANLARVNVTFLPPAHSFPAVIDPVLQSILPTLSPEMLCLMVQALRRSITTVGHWRALLSETTIRHMVLANRGTSIPAADREEVAREMRASQRRGLPSPLIIDPLQIRYSVAVVFANRSSHEENASYRNDVITASARWLLTLTQRAAQWGFHILLFHATDASIYSARHTLHRTEYIAWSEDYFGSGDRTIVTGMHIMRYEPNRIHMLVFHG